MTKEDFVRRYRDEMQGVRVSPELKQRTLKALIEQEESVMKKKCSAALAFAMALLICAVAVAAASRFGMLDFAKRQDNYVPEDAQSYVQSDVMRMENELVTVELRELYYDGLVSRMTVDVKPKSDKIMLLAEDMMMEDPWINMTPMQINFDKIYTETVLDVYRNGDYEAVYSVSPMLRMVGNDDITGGTGDHNLNDDGTFTVYQQWEYASYQPQREVIFSLTLFPYTETLDQLDIDGRIDLKQPITLTEADYDTQTYESTTPVVFPSVGVQVDKLTIDVRAQEIHATIDFTVIDAEAYAKLDEGLWFEFVDPNSAETEPYHQRLQSGLVGGGTMVSLNEAHTRYRQKESLGRNELHEAYTLRAFNAWDKQRYETKEVPVEKR